MSERTLSVAVETIGMTIGTKIGRMTGMVKWFNSKSGFGFITVCSDNENKGNDIFVHYSAKRLVANGYL